MHPYVAAEPILWRSIVITVTVGRQRLQESLAKQTNAASQWTLGSLLTLTETAPGRSQKKTACETVLERVMRLDRKFWGAFSLTREVPTFSTLSERADVKCPTLTLTRFEAKEAHCFPGAEHE